MTAPVARGRLKLSLIALVNRFATRDRGINRSIRARSAATTILRTCRAIVTLVIPRAV